MKKDLIIILLLILPAIAQLIRPGFFQIHDNLQPMRQLQIAKCFSDGQIPCRWVPDMGLGFGYPLFNYYPPFPYYLGQVFTTLQFSYIDTVKIVGILGFIWGAYFMYLLGKEFWGREGGVISAAFFTYAPYHSVDFYVRGAVNEFWAMTFYPAVFYFSYRLIKKPSVLQLIYLSLSLAGLMLSHNLMLMIFTPFLAVWILFWLLKTRSYFSLKHLLGSSLLALGLAAFFTIPVLFEQKYVHIETLTVGYFNYLQHFLDLKQIFWHINWGYGSSGLYQRTMSFAIGYLHWIIPALLVIPTIFFKKFRSFRSLLLLFCSYTLFSLFMTHWKSNFIWEKLPYLQYLQFPWRFLTLGVFFSSFISGAIVLMLPAPSVVPLSGTKWGPALLIFLVILLNGNYFKPSQWWPSMTDTKLFSGNSWRTLQAASIYDYLPKSAQEPPADPAGSNLNLTSGTYTTISKKSHYQEYQITSSIPAVAEIQTFYFPGWKTYVDGKLISPQLDKLFGRPQTPLPSGTHTLIYKFIPTPIRQISDIVSIISWIILFGLSFKQLFLKKITDRLPGFG